MSKYCNKQICLLYLSKLIILNMEKGTKLNYYGKECEVIKSDLTHVVIKFKSGTIICTPKSTFSQTK